METTSLFLAIPIVTLVGVTLNAAFPLYRLVRELSTIEDKVMKQMEEIHVMLLVFDECEKLLENKRFNMQRSLGAVLLTCDNRRRDLLMTERQYRALNDMQKSRQTVDPFLHRFFLRRWFQYRLVMHERRQRNFYAAFRESTLLLQEMCSGVRTEIRQEELLEASTGLSKIIQGSLESGYSSSDETATEELATNRFKYDRCTGDSGAKAYLLEPRAPSTAIQELRKLVKTHFTRNATIVLENPMESDPSQRFRYQPVRVKMDTGSDANMLSQDFVTRLNIPTSRIPEGDRPTLVGFDGSEFIPASTVNLTWYFERQMKQWTGTFYVVNTDLFSMILGSNSLEEEFFPSNSRGALVIGRRRRSKQEKTNELAITQQQTREAEEAEQIELQEMRRKREAARAKASTPGSSSELDLELGLENPEPEG